MRLRRPARESASRRRPWTSSPAISSGGHSMVEMLNTRLVGHLDCADAGQVWVDGPRLYIGHVHHPDGKSVVDVSDPRTPRSRAYRDPEGWHSHKVWAANGLRQRLSETPSLHGLRSDSAASNWTFARFPTRARLMGNGGYVRNRQRRNTIVRRGGSARVRSSRHRKAGSQHKA